MRERCRLKTLPGEFAVIAAGLISIVVAVQGQVAAGASPDCSGPRLVRPGDSSSAAEALSSRTQDWVVRLIYFKPTDRTPRPRLEEELDRWIYRARLWLKQEMGRLGYPNRTFEYEKHPDGRLLVHTFFAAQDSAYYQADINRIDAELNADPEYSDMSKEAQIVLADVQIVNPDGTLIEVVHPTGGKATGTALKEGGRADLDLSYVTPLDEYLFDDETPEVRTLRLAALPCGWYATSPITVGSIDSDNFAAPLHELLHAFGLVHDYESDADTMIMGRGVHHMRRSLSPWGPAPNTKLSSCHATRLNRSPFLDPALPTSDTSGPQVTIQQPSFGQHFASGAPITLKARVQDSGSGVGLVEFVTSGAGDTVDCKEPGGGSDVTVQTTVNGLEPGSWTLEVYALDLQGNAGSLAHRIVNIVVDPTPAGADLIPFGICHDPPDPRPGTTVRVVAGAHNRGSASAAAGAKATWDRNVASLPASGPGDREGTLPSVAAGDRVFVELGTYAYGGGQEQSALRIDRLNSVSEINEGDNGVWPLRFGDWPYCHGSSEIQGLTVSKSADASTLTLTWTPTVDLCQVRYRVLAGTTPRPSSGTGHFPSDPDFRDLTIDDQDGNASDTDFTIAMPTGDGFFLVVGEGGTGYSGPAGHYGE